MNQATSNQSGPGGPAVLLIDAEPASREVLQRDLRAAGCQVVAADDAAEGLVTIVDIAPDVLVLNAGAPDALAQIDPLRTTPVLRDAPLLAVAPADAPATIDRLFECGADDVLTTPVKPLDLAARIRSLVKLRSVRQELIRCNAQRAEQTNTLLALFDLSSALGSDEGLDDLLQRIVVAAAGLARAQQAVILLPTASHRELAVVEAFGLEANSLRGVRVPSDRGVLGRVFQSGKLTIVPAIESLQERKHKLPWWTDGEYVCVPLNATVATGASSCTGLLCLGARYGNETFSDSDLECLALVGNFSAATIQGALARFWRDEARDSLVLALVGLTERRDNDTARHLDRVTAFSLLLAEELRKSPRFAEIDDTFISELRRSAPLHDVGKVAIPDSVLMKPGRLTPEEMELMKSHSAIGAETIRAVRLRLPNSTFAKMAEEIARHHHERFDGKGYPDGLRGRQIPLSARIVALADVYDALTTKRVYKAAMSHEDASAIILREVGTQFDPDVIEAFKAQEAEFRRYAAALSDHPEDHVETPSLAPPTELPLHWFLSSSGKRYASLATMLAVDTPVSHA